MINMREETIMEQKIIYALVRAAAAITCIWTGWAVLHNAYPGLPASSLAGAVGALAVLTGVRLAVIEWEGEK